MLLVVVALHRELGDTTGRNRGERQVTLVYKGRVYGCVCVYVCERHRKVLMWGVRCVCVCDVRCEV